MDTGQRTPLATGMGCLPVECPDRPGQLVVITLQGCQALLNDCEAGLVGCQRVTGVATVLYLEASGEFPDSLGLSAVVFPLLQGRSYGWPAWCWPCLAAGVITLAALALGEARRRHARTEPLLPVGLFRIRSFSAGLAVQLLAFGGYSGFMLTSTLWLQDGQGYTPCAPAWSPSPSARAACPPP